MITPIMAVLMTVLPTMSWLGHCGTVWRSHAGGGQRGQGVARAGEQLGGVSGGHHHRGSRRSGGKGERGRG